MFPADKNLRIFVLLFRGCDTFLNLNIYTQIPWPNFPVTFFWKQIISIRALSVTQRGWIQYDFDLKQPPSPPTVFCSDLFPKPLLLTRYYRPHGANCSGVSYRRQQPHREAVRISQLRIPMVFILTTKLNTDFKQSESLVYLYPSLAKKVSLSLHCQ